MKVRIISIITILILAIGNQVAAQTLQERMAAKLLKKMGGSSSDASSSKSGKLDPNVSQSAIAVKWEDKVYDKYMPNYKEAESKGVKIKIDNKDGQVNSVWVNDVEYRSDEYGKSDFVRYYKTTGGDYYKLAFTENQIVFFTVDLSGHYSQKFFLNKRGSYNNLKLVMDYIKASEVNQKEDLELYAKNEKANSDKAAADRKAKFSIEGKKVTKIEVTNIKAQYGFGYYRPFTFSIKATLADGKTISTSEGGFLSDYTITYKNVDVKSGTIQDTKFVTGDKIVIEAQSKYDATKKGTGSAVMNYGETLTLNNNTNNWSESAFNYRLEVKQRKHAVTGKQVIMIKSIDLSGYKKPKYMIIDADKSLNIYTNGSNGCKTAECRHGEGSGGNGGNGGNITVIKDPSVKSFNINYSMNGGTGGSGTYGYNRGRDGRDGVYKVEVRTVNF